MKKVEAFFNGWFSLARDYAKSGYADWWWVILTPAAILVLTILLNRFLIPNFPNSREFQIRYSMQIAISVLLLVYLGSFSYLWANTSYYLTHTNEFIHWLSVLILCVISLIGWGNLAVQYSRRKAGHLLHPALTVTERKKFQKTARALFQKIKRWFFVPGAGFLMLLLILNKPNYLLAILLDNSSSMTNYLEQGRQSLSNTIRSLDPNTDIILSWFTETSPKNDISLVKASPSWNGLEGQHAFFSDKVQAIQYLQSATTTKSTPLYETIYSQYLYAKAQVANTDYAEKVLIIITDGDEAYLDKGMSLSELFCSDPEFDEFWNDVGIMNLGGDLTDPFYDKVLNTCQYYVEEDATALDSYEAGIAVMTAPLQSNWYFPAGLGVVFLLWFSIVFLTNPRAF